MTTNNELEFWALDVARVYRAATRDQRVRAAGAFVIFLREDAKRPEYAPSTNAPAGAYVVERWVRGRGKWELRDE
jgi:hypothetical protein